MHCNAPGCPRQAAAKGLCMMHYARLRRYGTLQTRRRTRDFWSKVDRRGPTECWNWSGYIKPSNGHGLTMHNHVPMHASKKAWVLTHGPVEDGMCVCHKCDNKLCCNPEHMYIGTVIDNILDQWEQPPFEQRRARDSERRFMFTDEQLLELWRMRRAEQASVRQCAERFGVHISTVYRYLNYVNANKLERRRAKRNRQNVQADPIESIT